MNNKSESIIPSFQIRDFLNYIISGFLWLAAFCQINFIKRGEFFHLLQANDIINNGLILGVILILFAFVLGVLLRPTMAFPVFVFNIIFGDPINWVYRHPDCLIQRIIQKLLYRLNKAIEAVPLINKELKEICRKILYLLCLDQKPLNKYEIKSVDDYFNKKKCGKMSPKEKLNAIETELHLKQKPIIYDRMRNYQHFVESIMSPVILNTILFLFFNQNNFPVINSSVKVILLIGILLILFNCYKHYKTEYYKGVFRSVSLLNENENGEP